MRRDITAVLIVSKRPPGNNGVGCSQRRLSQAPRAVAWNAPGGQTLPIGRRPRTPAFVLPNRSRDKDGKVMGFFSQDIKNMDDLFMHTLRDIYYAEKQIVQALPEMIEKSTDAQLKQGFQSHLRETETHVKRLEKVFQLHGKEAKGVDCPAIDGIIEEAEEVAGEVADKSVLDAALIAAAQAVEHYEITRYGSLIAWAKELGRNDCATLLQQNLDEEKAADKKLTAMAESKVNRKAA
jgi:ferritin-like metal-binding protein YciE